MTSRNLIISPTGKQSYFKKWTKGECDFDIILLCYEDIGELPLFCTPYVYSFKGEKWHIIKKFVLENLSFVSSYDNVWFVDDDIYTYTESINKLFDVHRRYKLKLSQPSVTGFTSHWITNKVEGNVLRYTNFVEIMCPMMSTETMIQLLPTFDYTESGWGLDLLWAKMLGYPTDKIAIIDEIMVTHSKPVGGNYERFKIHPHDELQAFMKEHDLRFDAQVFSTIKK